MRFKPFINGVIKDWHQAQNGRSDMLREDIYREALFWSIRLILGAIHDEGVRLEGQPGNPPLGVLYGLDRTTQEEVDDIEIWDLYETFYNVLTSGIGMDNQTTYSFVQYMREHADVILKMRAPVGGFLDDRTASLITEVFTNNNNWEIPPELSTIWNIDYICPRIDKNQLILWKFTAPTLRELINAYGQLFNRLVGLPPEDVNEVDFLVRHGHDFRYPRYAIPSPEQMRAGVGLRIEDAYLMPSQDLVAKALAHELDAPGLFTMVIPELGMSCEYQVSRITDRSFRVEQMVASEVRWPRWVLEAFPDKRDKLK